RDVTTLLTRGLTTTRAGGFFFLPSLLQLGASDLVASLGPTKHAGLPPERLALGLVFESLFGYTVGIRAVDALSRTDFGLLARRPLLSAAAVHSVSLPPGRFRTRQPGLPDRARPTPRGARPDHARSPRQRRCPQHENILP